MAHVRWRQLLNESKHAPYDPVAQQRDVKINEEADLPASQTEVSEELGFMHWSDAFNRLDFHDYGFGY